MYLEFFVKLKYLKHSLNMTIHKGRVKKTGQTIFVILPWLLILKKQFKYDDKHLKIGFY